jgi:hypothetical protein
MASHDKKLTRYRQAAENCRNMAGEEPRDEYRVQWLTLAEQYDQLATQAEMSGVRDARER